jgi:hypothetical protein
LSIPFVHGSSKPADMGTSVSDYMDHYIRLRDADLQSPHSLPFQSNILLGEQRNTIGTDPISALSAAALPGPPNIFPIDSYDSIQALKNLLPTSDTYESVVDYWVDQIQPDFDVQSFSIPRANSTFQSAQVSEQFRGNSPVTLAFPSPKTLASQLQIQMMFIARLNNKKGRVGLDTMCQGSGFLTQAFCNAASPTINISKVSSNPHIKTLPSVTTGNGRIGIAVGFAQVRMIIGGFVSDVEFVVFGKFAGFDAVLGQEWLKRYQCVLDMGTGRVTISADNRKFIISAIDTRQ